MNSKMAINSQLSTTESKKTNKQNRKIITDMEIIWRVISWEENGENVQGLRNIICRYKIDRRILRLVTVSKWISHRTCMHNPWMWN